MRDLFLVDLPELGPRGADAPARCTSSACSARYLPEWGALTCLVQYDVYHKFTADQHSLLAVENLEALAPGQSPESEGTCAGARTSVERPDLLMLGMLLHDIGKGKGHGHVAKGIPLIEALTARIGLPPEDAGRSVFLVAHHLTMSHTAAAPRHRRPQDVGVARRGGRHARSACACSTSSPARTCARWARA